MSDRERPPPGADGGERASPSLPERWRTVRNPDTIVDKYRPQNPTLYVREGHDIGVHVIPVGTSSPHDDDRYRAGAVRGNRDDLVYEERLETFADRADAVDCALRFAARYEAAYDGLGEEEAALRRAVETLS
ncbi:MAG: hypothetical protein ABEJ79_02670 [Halolamina sp.]